MVSIPDGYCSSLTCTPGAGAEACGDGGYCFDLQPYLAHHVPLGACLKDCTTVADCRDGYECTDGSGGPLPALAHKACVSPDLLCLLGAPDPSCPGHVGDACTGDTECNQLIDGICLTADSFTTLTGDAVTFPGGYCSRDTCTPGTGSEGCGENGYCFDLAPYNGSALGACLKNCTTVGDCREGYECTDGTGSTMPMLAHTACVPPEFACWMGVASACP